MHEGEDVLVFTISEAVVKKFASLLSGNWRVAHDVGNRDLFGKGSTDSAEGTELSRAEGGDDSTNAVHACISVGRISPDELVRSTDPGEPQWLYQIQEGELIIARNTKNALDADLLQAAEEIVSDQDLGHDGLGWWRGISGQVGFLMLGAIKDTTQNRC